MNKSLNISSYVVLIGVIVSVISSCAMRTELCSVKTHSKCVPIESYKGWNECIVQCQEIKLMPKLSSDSRDGKVTNPNIGYVPIEYASLR